MYSLNDSVRSAEFFLGPNLLPYHVDVLIKELYELEVLWALKQMKPWATPVYDGYLVASLCSFGRLFKSSLLELVSSPLNSGAVPQAINITLMSLIPKVDIP